MTNPVEKPALSTVEGPARKGGKPSKLNPTAFRATIINIFCNGGLFFLKLYAALVSGSIALLSEAFNSLTDMVSSIAIFVCVKISDKEADEGHPFGHKRAEPVAGITVAVFAAVLGFQIIKSSVERIFKGGDVLSITWFTLLVPLITILVKAGMAFYFSRVGKAARSPAIAATAVDSLSDVFVALAALIGIAGARLGYAYLDPVAGLAISVWIIYAGYRIGMENIDYLMGKSPDKAMMEEIKAAALGVPGVKNINTARAHYIGPFIHVEIHIEVPKYLSTFDSHAISKEVERAIGRISAIEKAFVHIDPV